MYSFTNTTQYSVSEIKQCAHLYDEENNPKIIPEKYAVKSAELENNVFYNHTPDCCLNIVEEAKLIVHQA
jgi:hypothetical protein